MQISLTLTSDLLNQFSPFYFAFDENFKILSFGDALAKVCSEIRVGSRLDTLFFIEQPPLSFDFDSLRTARNKLFIVGSLNKSAPNLKGQMLYFKQEGMLAFIGAPLVNDLKQISSFNLSFRDFAVHDPTIDYLFLLETTRTALSDARQFSDQLAQQALFNLLISHMRAGVMVQKADGALFVVNQAFCNMFSIPISPAELVGTQGLDLAEKVKNLLADPKHFIDHIYELMKSRRPCLNEEVQLTDGRVYETDYIPIFSGDKTLVGHMAQYRDITERKQLLAKMLSSAKMATLGEMATGIAHEINSPLTIIACKATELMNVIEQGEDDPEKVSEYVGKIEDTAMRISSIVQSMQAFGRNSVDERLEQHDLADILLDVLNLCQEKLKKQGIELRVDSIPRLVKIQCRRVQIGQVLLNLLNNARDAVEEFPEKWISIETKETSSSFKILITDSGPGIPVHLREKIMEPFFTTKSVGKGTGLGLSISKKIVEGHQGSLTLDTTHPHTCFVLALPRFQGAPQDNFQTFLRYEGVGAQLKSDYST